MNVRFWVYWKQEPNEYQITKNKKNCLCMELRLFWLNENSIQQVGSPSHIKNKNINWGKILDFQRKIHFK